MELQEIIDLFRHYKASKVLFEKRCRQLDAYASGDIWRILKPKLPDNQLLSDTNYVDYITTNQVNCIYSGGYLADVNPANISDKALSDKLNAFLEHIFEKKNLKLAQLKAGTSCALYNVGAIQFYWDNKRHEGLNTDYVGDIDYDCIDPASLYLSPDVSDYRNGKALFIAKTVHIPTLFSILNEEEIVKVKTVLNKQLQVDSSSYGIIYTDQHQPTPKDQTVSVLTAYIRNDDGGLDSYIIVNEDAIIVEKHNIKPNSFPVCVLYNQLPTKDPYGISVPRKVLKNITLVNILQTMPINYVYNSQKTATIVSADIGVTADEIANAVYNPESVLVIHGDPQKAIRKLELPPLPDGIPDIIRQLEQGIFLVSGIDPTYTGRQTNSITTTGGIERLQQKASETDNSRITLLESFAEQMTETILKFYIEFADLYEIPAPKDDRFEKEVRVIDFKEIRDNKIRFQYSMVASPYLPRNRVRYADAANQIMTQQMQFQMNPPLITPEEWLSYQDFPQKHLIRQRMDADRLRDDVQDISETVSNFASLTQQGVSPDGAIQMLADEKAMMRAQPTLGNVAPGSPQAAQMGGNGGDQGGMF